MPWFVVVIFGIYLAMNSYLFGKVFVVYPQLGKLRFLVAIFLGLMVAGPVLARYLEKWHLESVARGLGFVFYSWGAIILWFVMLMAAVDLYNGCLRLAATGWPQARLAIFPGRMYMPVIGGIVVALLVYGLYQAQNVYVHRLSFTSPNVPAGKTVRLVEITDMHLGEHMNHRRFERIVELIRQEQPDAIFSLGDLVDTSPENLRAESAALALLQPPLGKFAVLGNHEFYNGLKPSLAFHEACGFKLLRGQSVLLGDNICLAGVDDPAGRRLSDEAPKLDEAAALAAATPAEYTILLKHQPRVNEESQKRFNLQLSGHTHGGQVFPFHLITRLFYHHYRGLYDLGAEASGGESSANGPFLYVSVGSGTWGPPIRVFAQPEVVVITLSRGG